MIEGLEWVIAGMTTDKAPNLDKLPPEAINEVTSSAPILEKVNPP